MTVINTYTYTGVGVFVGSGSLTVTPTAGYYLYNTGTIGGVTLYSASTLVNKGSIAGTYYGVYAMGSTITNTGQISNSGEGGGGVVTGGAVKMFAASTLDNKGNIFGSGFGVYANASSVTNTGTIQGGQAGVEMSAGTLNNGGYIIGISRRSTGVYARSSTVTNTGTIVGAKLNGVDLTSASTLDNIGSISGGTYGVYANASTVTNSGTITGHKWGAQLKSASTLDNGGSIGGSTLGVYAKDSTVTNSGTISGGTLAVELRQTSTLNVLSGAVFKGAVTDDGTGVLNLAGTTAGTLDMGGSFSGFEHVSFVSADWVLGGTTNELADGETITGFTLADTLVLEGFTATSDSFVSGTGLELGNGTTTVTIDLTGPYTGPDPFNVTDVSAGTMIEENAVCYLRGTRIATVDGETAIEELQIGDMVVSRFGGLQPVLWIGRQTFARTFVKNNRGQIPVHIRAGALGGGVPARDLFVSPGHSMLLGDVLVLAHDLVNGITITQDVCPETLEYFNLELGRHDCVRAEGAWSESFADGPGLRAKFHNAAEYLAMHPDYEAPDQLGALCAPRPEAGPALARALVPVLANAEAFLRVAGRGAGEMEGWVDEVTSTHITGWAMDMAYPELPVWLEIWSGGALLGSTLACNYRSDLEKAGKGAGRCAFSFALQVPLTGQAPIVRRANTAQRLRQTDDCQKMVAAA